MWSHKTLHAPFIKGKCESRAYGGRSISRVKLSEPPYSRRRCDFTTSSNILLEGYLFSPVGQEEKTLPVILIRTPYGLRKGGSLMRLSEMLVRHGYHILGQNTRGRFGSSGNFFPIAHEIEDGGETVKWLLTQSWCNGKIGLTGVSYLGLTAYATVGNEVYGQHVGAVVPILASSRLLPIFKAPNSSADDTTTGPVSLDLALRWLFVVMNLQLSIKKNLVGAIQFIYGLLVSQPELNVALMHVPVCEADELVTLNKKSVTFFQEGLRNLKGTEAFWDKKDRLLDLRQGIGRSTLPPLHIVAGWHDFFLHQQLIDYRLAAAKAPRTTKLTIGSFSHWNFTGFFPVVNSVVLNSFDHYLKGLPLEGPNTDLPVRVFVMQKYGRGEWVSLSQWPPLVQREMTLFLCPKKHLRNGLTDVDRGQKFKSYVFNPYSPTPAIGGPSFDPSNCGPRDQSRFEERDDVLVFSTDPLGDEIEICGTIRLILYVATSAVSTDFVGRLCDVFPNGTSVNVCDGIIRIERDFEATVYSNNNVSMIEDYGETRTFRLEFDIGVTAYAFQPGHQIRLQVCSGAHGRWARNYGTGESLLNATRMEAQYNSVFFGGGGGVEHIEAFSSRLILPRTNLF